MLKKKVLGRSRGVSWIFLKEYRKKIQMGIQKRIQKIRKFRIYAKFRRKVENNVKFVAIYRKRLSNSWHFYILGLSNLWLNEVETC